MTGARGPTWADLGAELGAGGLRVVVGEPIGPLTTYRVGGPAALSVRISDAAELAVAAGVLSGHHEVDVLVVGNGSNLLVADDGFAGVAVLLGDGFEAVDVDARTGIVVAGGRASLPVVARRSAAAGLRGFEWAVGVPGTIGGAVRMNAGGHGSDMAASLQWVRVVDLATGEDVKVPLADLDLSYRHSAIRSSQVVVDASLRLRVGERAVAEAEIAEIVRWRREHQPGGPNAGSVFANPPGDSAGRLIDAAGCKGLRLGSAVISEKHANFIQVDAGGRADDVIALMGAVRRRVAERFGVDLHPETVVVGTDVGGSGR